MARLIDADEAYKVLTDTYHHRTEFQHEALKEALSKVPTVDAIEVIRCKDCVYCKRFNDVWYSPKRDELLCTLYVATYHTTENDFCSRGERRDNGKAD